MRFVDYGVDISFTDLLDEQKELTLMECLMDTFEQNKIESLSVLSALPISHSHYNVSCSLTRLIL